MKLIASILLLSPPFEYTGVVATTANPPFDVQAQHVFTAGGRAYSVWEPGARNRSVWTPGAKEAMVVE